MKMRNALPALLLSAASVACGGPDPGVEDLGGRPSGVTLLEVTAVDQTSVLRMAPGLLPRLDAVPGGQFGHAVAINADTLVVGAPGDNDARDEGGTAYVFRYELAEGEFRFLQQLRMADGDDYLGHPSDYFGAAVAVAQNTIVVGAQDFGSPDNTAGRGLSVIFERPDVLSEWQLVQSVGVPDLAQGANFGATVAIDDNADFILVGAIRPGAVYELRRDGEPSAPWVTTQTVAPAGGSPYDGRFGDAIAIADGTLAVGTPGASQRRGAVYLFERSPQTGAWEEVQSLVPDQLSQYDQFGHAVTFAGPRLVVGAPGDDSGNLTAGAIYVFERDADGADWGLTAKIVAADAIEQASLGSAVAGSADMIVAGAEGLVPESTPGAVYGFVLQDEWKQLFKVPMPLAQFDSASSFGASLAQWANLVVAGAPAATRAAEGSGVAALIALPDPEDIPTAVPPGG
jgi:hypothetical protein